MGAKQSCPTPESPVYDATTCKSFVGTGCPTSFSSSAPVYDATTCKSFVGTGCSAPVYDATTCASIIKTAVDAKKCTPIFGLPYNDSNENVKKVLGTLQNVINKIQEIVCTGQLKYLILDSLNNKLETTGQKIPSDKLKDQMNYGIDQMKIGGIEIKSNFVTQTQFDDLKKLLKILVDVVITVNTVDGMVTDTTIKQTIIDIINSFCLDYKQQDKIIPIAATSTPTATLAPKQDGATSTPTATLAPKQDGATSKPTATLAPPNVLLEVKRDIINNQGQNWIYNKTITDFNDYIIFSRLIISTPGKYTDNSFIKIDIINATYKYSTRINGSSFDDRKLIDIIINTEKEKLTGETKINITITTGAGDPGIIIKEGSRVVVSMKPSVIKPTFGSMSSFGETCGCWTWIILLILVLAIVGYILYQNRATIKIPGLPQRIAQFGRQIKSIKRM